MNYIRSTDGAEMIEVTPHQAVNRAVLLVLGRRTPRDEVRPEAAETPLQAS